MGLLSTALALTGCWRNTYAWNQKLTVTVMTPQGERSGSAVTRVTAGVNQKPMMGNLLSFGVNGEATLVDLGQGKFLFALLSPGGSWTSTEYLAELVFAADLPNRPVPGYPDGANQNYEVLQSLRKERSIPQKHYPLLVTFTDINDPKSVKEVKPGKLSDAFGPGYSLKSITLEITDEPVTKGKIIKICKWLDDQKLIFIDWTRYPSGHPLRTINWQSFRAGN